MADALVSKTNGGKLREGSTPSPGTMELQETDQFPVIETVTYKADSPNGSGTSLVDVLKQKAQFKETDPNNVEILFKDEDSDTAFTVTIRRKLPRKFKIAPAQPGSGIMFDAEYTDQKTLFANTVLRTTDAEGNVIKYPGMPSLTELFDVSVNFFTMQGYEIKAIEGAWDKHPYKVGPHKKPIPSTNYDLYHKAKDQGKSPKEAALETPTGKAAASLGFTEPKIIHDNFAGVGVLFYKPDTLNEGTAISDHLS